MGASRNPKPSQPQPTTRQGLVLLICGFLLFFFGSLFVGSVFPYLGEDLGVDFRLAVMLGACVVMLWGVMWIVRPIVRRFRDGRATDETLPPQHVGKMRQLTSLPSPLQAALLLLCGFLLAGFSCVQSGSRKSDLSVLGFVAGLTCLTLAGVVTIAGKHRQTGAAVDSGTHLPLSRLEQGALLVMCGLSLVAFSGLWAVMFSLGPGSGEVSPIVSWLIHFIGVPGMVIGGVFFVWGVILVAVGRQD